MPQVRCVASDPVTQRLVTLDTDNFANLWDPVGSGDMRVLRTIHLATYDSAACMHLEPNFLAVGFRGCLALFDPRRRSSVAQIPVATMRTPLCSLAQLWELEYFSPHVRPARTSLVFLYVCI